MASESRTHNVELPGTRPVDTLSDAKLSCGTTLMKETLGEHSFLEGASRRAQAVAIAPLLELTLTMLDIGRRYMALVFVNRDCSFVRTLERATWVTWQSQVRRRDLRGHAGTRWDTSAGGFGSI